MAFAQIPRAGLGEIQQGQNYLDGLANRFIVKPKTVSGIGGFVFDYEGETSVQLQSEITDHYLEDNSPVHDHIAKKPPRITLRGFVGELVMKKPAGILGALDFIQNKLTTVPAYLGKYTPTQIAKIQAAISKTTNVVNTVNQSLSRINNVVSFFDKAAIGKTNQEKAYKQLQTLWANQTLLIIVTPYNTHNNMVIENLIFIQPEDTKFWSDIIVTMKHLTFVGEETVSVNKNANRHVQKVPPSTNNGQSQGTPTPEDTLRNRFNGAFGQLN